MERPPRLPGASDLEADYLRAAAGLGHYTGHELVRAVLACVDSSPGRSRLTVLEALSPASMIGKERGGGPEDLDGALLNVVTALEAMDGL